MSGALNLRDLASGDAVTTLDGETLVVVDNPGDGAWIIATDTASGETRPVYVNEIVPDDE